MAGPFKSARLTRAAFSTLLGPFSFDPQAKAQAGQAAVYVINGFRCAPCLILAAACALECHRDVVAMDLRRLNWVKSKGEEIGQ